MNFTVDHIDTVIRFGKYEDVIAVNRQLAVSYASIELDINQQLSLVPSTRIPGKLYLNIITDKIQELFSRSPLIPGDFPNQETENTKQTNDGIPIQITDRRMIYELERLYNNI